MIQTVKEQRNIETGELQGYLVNGSMFVPLDKGNTHYQEVQEWIANGGSIEPAYTDVERFNYVKNKKLDEINHAFEAEMRLITSQYPETERLSWDKQEQEARAFLADNTVVTPLLDAITTTRNIDKTTLAQRIIDKADAYALAVGSAIGKRQYLEDLINLATTIEELEQIKW